MNIKNWTDADKINFKKKLKNFCVDCIKEKIEEAITSMKRAQEAANDEEKNAMGDKYEITKVMGQIDSDRAGLQLFEGKKQLSQLQLVNVESICKEVQTGAFIICNEGNYFITASIGGKIIEDEKINFISANAPIALALMHKKVKGFVDFKGRHIELMAIF